MATWLRFLRQSFRHGVNIWAGVVGVTQNSAVISALDDMRLAAGVAFHPDIVVRIAARPLPGYFQAPTIAHIFPTLCYLTLESSFANLSWYFLGGASKLEIFAAYAATVNCDYYLVAGDQQEGNCQKLDRDHFSHSLGDNEETPKKCH
ncbi:hypothetical protein O181_024565 [Austropuccinia psidii MF-1]|uniref:Uncharacterized protein n=1 Tax=Austropuccinia psidii MF-1 TaxID=1389203 RepID=A0A9Q3CKS6_9BASI|nr:hypothetical protein [Austropuccinia psidii MF-1]